MEFAKAGASLVQLYTAMIWEGVGVAARIKKELAEELGGRSWKSIVGEDGRVRAQKKEWELEKLKKELAAELVKGDEGLEVKWEHELKEAKAELEQLLGELTTMSDDTVSSPIAIPEISSPPSISERLSTPEPTPTTESTSTPSPVVDSLPTPRALEALSLPAAAVLDHDTIISMLDPGKEQVEHGLVGMKVEEATRKEDVEEVKPRLV